MRMGLTNVKVLKGGWEEWEKRRLPTQPRE